MPRVDNHDEVHSKLSGLFCYNSFSPDTTVQTTPWHLFLIQEGWTEAEDLREGDAIVSLGGVYGTVDSVIIENIVQTMYDLTVEDVHNFAVGEGDWVVHNCGKQLPLFPEDANPPPELLGNEGRVGSYNGLERAYGTVGDNLTPHHMPPDKYMDSGRGPAGYTNGQGTAMFMEEGRHIDTWSYGRNLSSYSTMTPRDLLAKDIWDVRRIYMEAGLYDSYIRGRLQEVIERNHLAWPGYFDK